MRGQKRKRYVMLTSEKEVSPAEQKDAVRLLLQRYPDLESKRMVWVGHSLIFRTDQVRLPEIKLGLVIKLEHTTLSPKLTSGSISKLKRAANFG